MDKADRHDLIQTLYALMTALLEDATMIAVGGQGAADMPTAMAIANRLGDFTSQIPMLVDAVKVAATA